VYPHYGLPRQVMPGANPGSRRDQAMMSRSLQFPSYFMEHPCNTNVRAQAQTVTCAQHEFSTSDHPHEATQQTDLLPLRRHSLELEEEVATIVKSNKDSQDEDDYGKKLSKSARRRQRRRMLRQQHMQTQLSAAVSHCLSDDEASRSGEAEHDWLLCADGCRDGTRIASLSDRAESCSPGLPCTWQLAAHLPASPTFPALSTTPSTEDATSPLDHSRWLAFQCNSSSVMQLKEVIELGVKMHSQAGTWLQLPSYA
jgi:hypothetical protein